MIFRLLCAAACIAAFAAPASASALDMSWFDSNAYRTTAFEVGERAYIATFSLYSDGFAAAYEALGPHPTTEERLEFLHTRGSIALIDVTDPEWPAYVSGAYGHRHGFEIPEEVRDMEAAAIGGNTYLFAAGDGMVTLNVTTPENPSQVSRIPAELLEFGSGDSISVHQVAGKALAFVGSNILDVSDPSSPVLISRTAGGPAKGAVELSGRTYVLMGAGERVLDMTDPYNPTQVDFDHMVTLEMWFETDYPVEFAATEGPGSRMSAPMSDFHPTSLLEIRDRLYATAYLRTESSVIWYGLIDVTAPERPVAVPHEALQTRAAFVAEIGERLYVFPHPDYPYPDYPWLDRDAVFDITGGMEQAAVVSYEPLDYWGDFVNAGGEVVLAEPQVYNVEIGGRTYVLKHEPWHGQHAVLDVTDLMRDTPYVLRTDLAPGHTALLIEDYHNGTGRYVVVPDIQPGGWWSSGPRGADSYPRTFEQQVGFLPDGYGSIRSMADIGNGIYGLETFGTVVNFTDTPSVVTPVLWDSRGIHSPLAERVSDAGIVQISGVPHAAAGPGPGWRFVDAGPVLSGYALPDSAPASHGSELLPHQAIWLVPVSEFDYRQQTQGGYTEISHDGEAWRKASMPVPDDAVLTEAGGRTYALAVMGNTEASWNGGIYAFDTGSGTATRLPGASEFGVFGSLTMGGGTRLYDVSDPRQPAEVQPKGVRGGFFGLGGVSDFAVTEISGKTYAVVATRENRGAIQVVDISDPAELKPVSAIFAGPKENGWSGSQGVAIAEIGDRTYAVAAPWGHDPLVVVDITNPEKPAKTGIAPGGRDGFLPMEEVTDVGVAHTAGGAYALVVSRGDDAVQVVDISNPASPKPAGSISTMHWPRVIEVTEIDGGTYAVILGRGGGIRSDTTVVQITDVTNPESPRTAAKISKSAYLKSATDVAVADIGGQTYALVASSGKTAGYVQILDISNPRAPVRVAGMISGSGDLLPWRGTYGIGAVEVGGKAYMTVSTLGGTQLVDISDPSLPAVGPEAVIGSNPVTVGLGGGTYVASGGGIHLTNATDPLNPEYVMGVGDSNTYWCEPGRVDVFTWAPGTRC